MEYRIRALDGRVRWIRECARAKEAGRRQRPGRRRGHRRDRPALARRRGRRPRRTRSARRGAARLGARHPRRVPLRVALSPPWTRRSTSSRSDRRRSSGVEPGPGAAGEWLVAVHPDDRERPASRCSRRSLPARRAASSTACATGTAARAGCSTAGPAGATPAASSPRASSPTSRPRGPGRHGRGARRGPGRVRRARGARLAAERASNTDPLTGLANRRSFQRSLERRSPPPRRAVRPDPAGRRPLQAHQRHARPPGGDDVLWRSRLHARGSARRTRRRALGRRGFTVLVRGVRSHDALRALAENIRATRAREPLATRRGALAVTISCGGVLSSAGRDTEELVHAADAAMYRAKQTGRDRTCSPATSPRTPLRPHRRSASRPGARRCARRSRPRRRRRPRT